MVPWKISQFEITKDVILGAKQDKMIIKFDSKLSAGLPFKCMNVIRSAVDRIKKPGSKSWTSDPSCSPIARRFGPIWDLLLFVTGRW